MIECSALGAYAFGFTTFVYEFGLQFRLSSQCANLNLTGEDLKIGFQSLGFHTMPAVQTHHLCLASHENWK